jgi:hypothetical protein
MDVGLKELDLASVFDEAARRYDSSWPQSGITASSLRRPRASLLASATNRRQCGCFIWAAGYACAPGMYRSTEPVVGIFAACLFRSVVER